MSRVQASSNITPGGFVILGDDEAFIMVDNDYTYDPSFTDRSSIVNVQNWFVVRQGKDGDIGATVIRVPISRSECVELAWALLSIARADRNWEGIE